ncbi:hypothetical protein BY996DRAFT_8533128 [Phakopsora pachyrhizi]|nr:hypothetical protein BY996DRAFT_8533128 [Phakopsora pachyrhizi]
MLQLCSFLLQGLEHQHNEVWEFVPSDVEEDLEDHWITDFPKEEEYQVISLEEDLKDYPYQELDQKPQLATEQAEGIQHLPNKLRAQSRYRRIKPIAAECCIKGAYNIRNEEEKGGYRLVLRSPETDQNCPRYSIVKEVEGEFTVGQKLSSENEIGLELVNKQSWQVIESLKVGRIQGQQPVKLQKLLSKTGCNRTLKAIKKKIKQQQKEELTMKVISTSKGIRPEDEQSQELSEYQCKSEEDRRVGSKEEILDKALVFCSRLERLGLSDGQMYPSRLLSILLFTLKEIEIWDGPRSGTSKVEGSGAFCAKDVVLARREAALFGLEKICIRRNNSSRIHSGMKGILIGLSSKSCWVKLGGADEVFRLPIRVWILPMDESWHSQGTGLEQDKDSTRIKGQKSRGYRIKRIQDTRRRKRSRTEEQDREAENRGVRNKTTIRRKALV